MQPVPIPPSVPSAQFAAGAPSCAAHDDLTSRDDRTARDDRSARRRTDPARRAVLAAASLAPLLGACAAAPGAAPPSAPSAGAPSAGVPGLPPPRRVDTVVGPIAVREAGRGPHTLVLWPSILADHTIYDAQIRAWSGTHRLVVVDGPGHGDSGPVPAPFTMADCAQALLQVLQATGTTQPVVVVGTSWGGLVGGEFALAHPGRTRAVVMLNTPIEKPEPGFAERFVTWGARWIHGTSLYADGVERAFFLPATRERGGFAIERFRAHLRRADGASLGAAVRSVLIDREPLGPRVAGIAAPVLVVAGTHDAGYPVGMQRDAAARMPRGGFVELPTAHISVVDAPQATLAAVDAFLARLPAG